uniref:Uncharacterized protein n=1 Tax=Quercus lobata TaxID=97700 RepID=A0A7N2L8H8_QUELO
MCSRRFTLPICGSETDQVHALCVVEYTLRMVPLSSEPFDLGFVAMRSLHRVLSTSPELNTFLAFLNTGHRCERESLR